MPIYEYECTQCGAVEEIFQKITEKPLAKCPSCNGKLQKLVSQSTFHLKGSGWYVTDYADKKRGGASSKKASKKATSTTSSKTPSSESSKSSSAGGTPS